MTIKLPVEQLPRARKIQAGTGKHSCWLYKETIIAIVLVYPLI